MKDVQPPDFMFADALLRALAQAVRMLPPGMDEQPPPPAAPDVAAPYGSALYVRSGLYRFRPQICVAGGKKLNLGYFPATAEGAAAAARVYAAARAAKEAGGDATAIRAAAQEARDE